MSGSNSFAVVDYQAVSFRALLVFLGECLLYAYFLLPFGAEKVMSMFSLTAPAQAEEFGTVFPVYTFAHLLALCIGVVLLILVGLQPIKLNKPFVAYCVANLAAIPWMFIFHTSSDPLYWDYVLELFRLFSLALLAIVVLEERHYDPYVLVRCLAPLLIIPVALVIFTNVRDFLSAREGRINAPGLEITSTGHISAIAVILGMSLPLRRPIRAVLFLVGGVSLLQSGSRLALLGCLVCAGIVVWRQHKSTMHRARSLIAVVILGALAIWFGSTNLSGAERLGTLSDSETLTEEIASGRALAFLAACTVIYDHPLGYVDSDWSIQEKLVTAGFPSHTHSNYLQSYLRFGPWAILFWGVFAYQTAIGLKRSSPYAPAMCFVLVGSLFDYYTFVTKAMIIIFIIASLNAYHIRKWVKENK